VLDQYQCSAPARVVAAPFLKWAGGKSSLLKQYARFFPTEPVNTYFEPFVGSGAVFFYLQGEQIARSVRLSDINAELINVYRVVRDDVEALIDCLLHHKLHHSLWYYYHIRGLDREPGWRERASHVERAARMIYLNKTCYNGLWRVNSRGEFNVPMGRYNNPRICDEPRLRAASRALRGVELAHMSFEEAVADAGPGDFVYFDPPYMPLSDTANFTSYTQDGFGESEQARLADVFRELDRRGVRVMLSNSEHPLVRKLYAGFRIEQVYARRHINSHANGRGPIHEVVVLNY